MSLTSGFYNSLNGDRKYDAAQMSSIFNGIINDGIFMNVGDAMVVKASSGNTITVGSGRAWFNGTWTNNDASYPIEASDSEAVLDRIDAVVLTVNETESVRANTLTIEKGTASTSAEKPTFTDTDYIHYHVLAYITRAAGSTEITQADIENNIGTDDVPYVTGILSTVSASDLLAQWQSEFGEWETKEKDDFITWFKNLQDILDEDVAAHLQNEIDELNSSVSSLDSRATSLETRTSTLEAQYTTLGIKRMYVDGATLVIESEATS